MKPGTIYSTKAEKYAKYRWDYAPEAIGTIVEITRISVESIVADIGAGTGILTRHLADKARQVFAIEPNAEFRQILARAMKPFSSVSVIEGTAERTGLSNDSVDVITAAQAIHWFNPQPSRKEMNRILKHGGWLALLRNYGTNREQIGALGSLMTEEYGASLTFVNEQRPERPIRFILGTITFTK